MSNSGEIKRCTKCKRAFSDDLKVDKSYHMHFRDPACTPCCDKAWEDENNMDYEDYEDESYQDWLEFNCLTWKDRG